MRKRIFRPDWHAIVQNIYANLIWYLLGAVLWPSGVGLDLLNLKESLVRAGLAGMLNQLIVIGVYFLTAVGFALVLYWTWRVAVWAGTGIRSENHWAIAPRDYGPDRMGVHFVGFAVEEPGGTFDAALEMFWFGGETNPDEQQFRFCLNLTSRRLKKTGDGQFVLAAASEYKPRGFRLVPDDGYYGEFVLTGYYKARVCLANGLERGKHLFDVLIRYDGRDAIKVERVVRVGRDDPLTHIPPENRTDDDGSRDWSTVPDFLPGQDVRSYRY